MHKSFALSAFLALCFLTLVVSELSIAGISATPKYLFLDKTKKSVAINVTNTGTEDDEFWVETKFGYVVSDDTGGVHVIADTSGSISQSAASWIKAYPPRFALGPDETQIIRLVVSPPAGLSDGEYWARIMVSSKPRKAAVSSKGTKFGSGLVLVTQLGLAFHYRVGTLSTGLVMNDFKTNVTDSTVDITMNVTRTGNAAFWGTRTIRVLNDNGTVVYTTKKDAVVYKSMLLRERISRAKLPPGNYSIETDFVSGSRQDIPNSQLIQAPPLRLTNPLLIR